MINIIPVGLFMMILYFLLQEEHFLAFLTGVCTFFSIIIAVFTDKDYNREIESRSRIVKSINGIDRCLDNVFKNIEKKSKNMEKEGGGIFALCAFFI